MLARILTAARRRPVRVVEAALALAAALGVGLTDSAEAQVVAIVVAVVGLIGGEAAQRHTTPTVDPRADNGLRLVAPGDYRPR